jgi:hypothetical protein
MWSHTFCREASTCSFFILASHCAYRNVICWNWAKCWFVEQLFASVGVQTVVTVRLSVSPTWTNSMSRLLVVSSCLFSISVILLDITLPLACSLACFVRSLFIAVYDGTVSAAKYRGWVTYMKHVPNVEYHLVDNMCVTASNEPAGWVKGFCTPGMIVQFFFFCYLWSTALYLANWVYEVVPYMLRKCHVFMLVLQIRWLETLT